MAVQQAATQRAAMLCVQVMALVFVCWAECPNKHPLTAATKYWEGG
jgi:hypothetical protein